MHFELLYFDDCPSWPQALENLKQALLAEGLDLDVSMVRVAGARHASSLRFQGSPSIRVSGRDPFPDQPMSYGLTCRVYYTEEGLKGWPTVRMICERLRILSAAEIPIGSGDAA